MANAEGVIGELKNQHGLDRVRSRGTPLFHVQLLLGCTALNCKRLADHVPEAASGVAAAPAATARDLQTTTPAACVVSGAAAPDAAGSAPAARPSRWNYTVCLN
jgi:hypothetical protein